MLSIRNKDCINCSLSSFNNEVCISQDISGNSKILIVNGYLDRKDSRNSDLSEHEPFKVLLTLLRESIGDSFDLNLIHLSYLVRCGIVGDMSLSKDMIDECFYYLRREIAFIKPKIIIALGDDLYKKLTGNRISKRVFFEIVKIDLDGQLYNAMFFESYKVIKFSKTSLRTKLQVWQRNLHYAYSIAVFDLKKVRISGIKIYKNVKDVEELLDNISQAGICSFDFETTRLDIHSDNFKATLVSLSYRHGFSHVIPLDHFQTPWNKESLAIVIRMLRDKLFANPLITKVAHNLKFDMKVARRYSMYPFRGRLHDTMLMHHLIDENESCSLKNLVFNYYPEYIGYDVGVYEYTWATCPLEKLAEYSGIDSDLTLRFCTLFEDELLKDFQSYRLYRNLIIPCLLVLSNMEYEGILIDRGNLTKSIIKSKQLLRGLHSDLLSYKEVSRFEHTERERITQVFISDTEQTLYALRNDSSRIHSTKYIQRIEKRLQDLRTGVIVPFKKINFNSWQQLRKLLYTPAGFDLTPSSSDWSTSKEALTLVDDPSGFINKLLLYKQVKKVLTTYLEPIYDKLDGNNRIHPEFLQHGTRTGRLSCKNPNVQNIPHKEFVKNDLLKEVVGYVREVFIVEKDSYLLQADYSQADLRVMAEFADEENMLKAYRDNKDIHKQTACALTGDTLEAFDMLPEETRKVKRYQAKGCNFGFIYGMGAIGFKYYVKSLYNIDITENEASIFRSAFFDMYPNILKYHKTSISNCIRDEYVRTLLGRKRNILFISEEDYGLRKLGERQALNSSVQGTVGEFTAFSLVMLFLRLPKGVKILNTVFDSILLSVPEHLLDETVDLVYKTMENLPLKQYFDASLNKVKMVVDLELSSNHWDTMAEIPK